MNTRLSLAFVLCAAAPAAASEAVQAPHAEIPALGVALPSAGIAQPAPQLAPSSAEPATALPQGPQLAQAQAPQTASPEENGGDSPIVIEGDGITEELKAALLSAANRVGALPPGVNVVIRSSSMWADNPQVSIYIDGRQVYWEYLYHSEANLARLRLKWSSPSSWAKWATTGKASPDLSKRFEAALRIAQEGAPIARAKAARRR